MAVINTAAVDVPGNILLSRKHGDLMPASILSFLLLS